MSIIEDVGAAEAAARLGAFRVVDVRAPEEYAGDLGHIPGAESCPLDGVLLAAADWNPEQPVLLVCRSGRRSRHAAELLERAGRTRLFNLTGGMMAWNVAGLDRCDGAHAEITGRPRCSARRGDS